MGAELCLLCFVADDGGCEGQDRLWRATYVVGQPLEGAAQADVLCSDSHLGGTHLHPDARRIRRLPTSTPSTFDSCGPK